MNRRRVLRSALETMGLLFGGAVLLSGCGDNAGAPAKPDAAAQADNEARNKATEEMYKKNKGADKGKK